MVERTEGKLIVGFFAATATLVLVGALGPGCGGEVGDSGEDAGGGGDVDAGPMPGVDGGPGEVHVLSRSSRSSAIDISEDDSLVVMINPEAGSISTFRTEDNSKLATVATGGEPSSVVIHPDGRTAYVANRADATVVAVTAIDTGSPVVSAPVEVGSEPTGLALSPTGARLFVAEHAEGRVSIIDTRTMAITGSIDAPQNPYALAVTNDGDADEGDELLIVPEFFGEPIPGGEATDESRNGRIRIYQLSDLAPTMPIVLTPIDSGFAPADGAPTVMTSPNQLYSVAVQGDRVYVTSISASAGPPVRFNANVHPVVYVGDLTTRTELRAPDGTTNYARLVFDDVPAGSTRFALADLVDIAFIGTSNIAYALSRGADVVQRVVYEPTGITAGSDINEQIEIGGTPAGASRGCQTPIGIATSHDAPRAYVNCWVSRSLGVVDLSMQALTTTVESTPPPTGADVEVAKGRRFFFTGRGRWSSEAWSACSSCHPGGRTDNMTWSFAAGPRQSTDLSGSYSHGSGAQVQRVFNWTGIFDEMHDFERNTRDVSGGLGAITSGGCGDLAAELRDPETLPGNLAQPIQELQDRAESCTTDWDAIDAWARTIRPTRGLRFLDAASVERGAALFGMSSASANNGQCVACHGGPGWTASRRFWTPSSATNGSLGTTAFAVPDAWPDGWNAHTTQIGVEPGTSAAPPQVACVLRNVGTFGVPGDDAAGAALEVRANGAPAQGRGGYNVPSLYGVAVGAPYLHHGQAGSLEELFDDPVWIGHLRAANPVFLTTGDAEQQKRDLMSFLLSIDAGTTEQPVPSTFEGCPTTFP